VATAKFWEQKDKSPIAAAFLTCSLIMAAYGAIGSLVANVLVVADMVAAKLKGAEIAYSGNYFKMLAQTYEHYQPMILAVTMASQFLVFVGLTAFVFKKWHGLPVRGYFRISRPRPLQVATALAGLVFVLPVAIGLGEISVRLFPVLRELEGLGNALVMAKTPLGLALVIGAIGLTPAICEEFLFRGYLHRTLSRKLRQPWAYVVSGCFFALIHQNYFGLATLILVGVYLGFLFSRFDSIWPGSAVHFAYNTMLVVMTNKPAAFSWLFDAQGFVRLPYLAIGFLGSAAMAALILLQTKGNSLQPDTLAAEAA
jgi:membrane protease YdiL (CAAX protease family)